MATTVNVLCYKSKTLGNGEHPLMICVCMDGKRKYKSLGVSVKAEHWNFDKNIPKSNCPNKEYINILIANKKKEYEIETLPIPKEALREALLNACINKDYAEPSSIQIRVYENKLEIVNGGVLPDGWTVETLLSSHRSFPYNPDIANTFFRSGEIEAWGRGIERIIIACKNDGFSTPEFRYDASGIWTVFKFEYPERATTQKTTQNLTEQQQAMLSFLKEHPEATRKEISESLFNITEDGVKYNLSRLQELGLLKRVGGRKQGFWKIIE